MVIVHVLFVYKRVSINVTWAVTCTRIKYKWSILPGHVSNHLIQWFSVINWTEYETKWRLSETRVWNKRIAWIDEVNMKWMKWNVERKLMKCDGPYARLAWIVCCAKQYEMLHYEMYEITEIWFVWIIRNEIMCANEFISQFAMLGFNCSQHTVCRMPRT